MAEPLAGALALLKLHTLRILPVFYQNQLVFHLSPSPWEFSKGGTHQTEQSLYQRTKVKVLEVCAQIIFN